MKDELNESDFEKAVRSLKEYRFKDGVEDANEPPPSLEEIDDFLGRVGVYDDSDLMRMHRELNRINMVVDVTDRNKKELEKWHILMDNPKFRRAVKNSESIFETPGSLLRPAYMRNPTLKETIKSVYTDVKLWAQCLMVPPAPPERQLNGFVLGDDFQELLLLARDIKPELVNPTKVPYKKIGIGKFSFNLYKTIEGDLSDHYRTNLDGEMVESIGRDPESNTIYNRIDLQQTLNDSASLFIKNEFPPLNLQKKYFNLDEEEAKRYQGGKFLFAQQIEDDSYIQYMKEHMSDSQELHEAVREASDNFSKTIPAGTEITLKSGSYTKVLKVESDIVYPIVDRNPKYWEMVKERNPSHYASMLKKQKELESK